MLENKDAETAPRPSETRKMGNAQQIRVVDDVKSIIHAHRLGRDVSLTDAPLSASTRRDERDRPTRQAYRRDQSH